MKEPTPEMLAFGGKDPEVLKRFMVEFFPFSVLKKVGFFTHEMKNDYYAQAQRVCLRFGYSSVFEYGAQEARCHLTYTDGNRPENEGFVTTITNIYQ